MQSGQEYVSMQISSRSWQLGEENNVWEPECLHHIDKVNKYTIQSPYCFVEPS